MSEPVRIYVPHPWDALPPPVLEPAGAGLGETPEDTRSLAERLADLTREIDDAKYDAESARDDAEAAAFRLDDLREDLDALKKQYGIKDGVA